MTFKEFRNTYLPSYKDDYDFELTKVVPGPGYYSFNCMKRCAKDGKRMIIGVIAMSVEAIPAAVYCTAISEKPTPTKGPKMVVAVATVNPFLSCMASRKGAIPLRKYSNSEKPMMPAMQR